MKKMRITKKRTAKKGESKSNVEALLLNTEKMYPKLLPFGCNKNLPFSVPRKNLLGRRKRRIRIPEVTFIAR